MAKKESANCTALIDGLDGDNWATVLHLIYDAFLEAGDRVAAKGTKWLIDNKRMPNHCGGTLSFWKGCEDPKDSSSLASDFIDEMAALCGAPDSWTYSSEFRLFIRVWRKRIKP